MCLILARCFWIMNFFNDDDGDDDDDDGWARGRK